jgi:hypothetical protein
VNAIQRIISSAGQKTHERFYGATFIWNGVPYPCTHGDIIQNPALIMGGFSANTEVIVSVRWDQFGDGNALRPKKADQCFLQPDPDNNSVFALYVTTVMTSVGDVVVKFLCHDQNQGA